MNTVQPMEIDNNYYSYRDKIRDDKVYPILYLDNGLTIYSDEENRILYDNKENKNDISKTKIDNFAKKYSKKRTTKTEAEKQIDKLEHILVDFEKNKKGKPIVNVMVNPDAPKLPQHSVKTNLNTNELNNLIDIGNSNNGCPEIDTPKCFLGFSLKYNNNQCPYTLCYEKIALNIILDIGLLAIAIAIVYFLYRLFKK